MLKAWQVRVESAMVGVLEFHTVADVKDTPKEIKDRFRPYFKAGDIFIFPSDGAQLKAKLQD